MTRRPDNKPETDSDRRFFDLRESGYQGPIDADGYATSGQAADILAALRQRAEQEGHP